MRKLGTTEDGKFIVELERTEFLVLSRLAQAIEGRTTWEMGTFPDFAQHVDRDITTAIGAVEVFATTKARVNELRALLDSVDAALTDAGRSEA